MSKPFTALVAAEIVGRKINLRVEFPTVPTIAELSKTAEHLFNGELAALRPDLVSKYSIKISKFKHYEESTQRWLELSGDLQYFDHKQMYAFQFPSPYYKETQQELPNPRIPVIPYDLMKRDLFLKGDSMSEKIRAIFHEMDSDGDGIVNFENMYNLFHQIGLNFSEATVKDLFNFGDRNRTGILSMVDFQVIGNRYPIMIDCLFYHSRHFCDNPQLRNELAQARETCEKAKESVNCIARSRDVSVKIVHAAQKNVSELDRELEDIRRNASNVSMYTQDIRKKSESMRMELLEVEGFIRNLQDQNSTHHMAHQKVHRAREVQFKKYHHSQLEVNRLNDLIVQLREQLRKAHEDLEQQQQIASDCQREMQLLQASEDHLNDLISDTSRSISESENHFSELKKTQERYNDQEKSFEVDFYSSQNKMNELLGKKSTLNATIDAENTELRRIETDYANALTFYQDAQLRSKELDKDLECILRTKQRVSGSERDLVEQEIRLKEQRSNLEERENALLRSASAIVTSVASGLSQ